MGGATVNLLLQFERLKSLLIFFLQISSGRSSSSPSPQFHLRSVVMSFSAIKTRNRWMQGSASAHSRGRHPSCGKSFCLKSKSNLVKHVESHLADLHRLCGICREQFDFSNDLINHLRSHRASGDGSAREILGKTFTNAQAHMRTDDKVKSFVCDSCGRNLS